MDCNNIALYKNMIGCSITELKTELFQIIEKVQFDVSIICRVKDEKTLRKKMVLKKSNSVFEIKDVYGFRILVSNTEEAYIVLDLIRNYFQIHLEHDYLENPKIRLDKPHLAGKSLKLLQITSYKNKVPFEIQITTFHFNKSNELLHDGYHKEKYLQP